MKKEIVVVGWSGGGVRVNQHIEGARKVKEKGIEVDAWCGNSSGILAALASAFDVVEEVARFLTTENAFDWIISCPINADNKYTWAAIGRAIIGKNYLGLQDVASIVKRFISKEEWDEYVSNPNSAEIFTTVINVELEEEELVRLNDYDYESMLLWVEASCSVYLMTPTVKINGANYCDAGIHSHNPAKVVCKHLIKRGFRIKELISFYTEHIFAIGELPSWIFPAVGKLVSMCQGGNTRDDLEAEKDFCLARKIAHRYIRFEDVYKNPYDSDLARANKSLEMAQQALKGW